MTVKNVVRIISEFTVTGLGLATTLETTGPSESKAILDIKASRLNRIRRGGGHRMKLPPPYPSSLTGQANFQQLHWHEPPFIKPVPFFIAPYDLYFPTRGYTRDVYFVLTVLYDLYFRGVVKSVYCYRYLNVKESTDNLLCRVQAHQYQFLVCDLPNVVRNR